MTENLASREANSGTKLQEVAVSVRDLLRSYDTVAYVLGVRQGRTVKNWAENGTIPADPAVEARLRVTEKLALTVKDEQRPWVSGAWLISCNPHLGQVAPMTVVQSIGTENYSEIMEARAEAAATDFAEWSAAN